MDAVKTAISINHQNMLAQNELKNARVELNGKTQTRTASRLG